MAGVTWGVWDLKESYAFNKERRIGMTSRFLPVVGIFRKQESESIPRWRIGDVELGEPVWTRDPY
jgi:hypothetical protein